MNPPRRKRASKARFHFALERAIRASRELSGTQRVILYTIAGHASYATGACRAGLTAAQAGSKAGLAISTIAEEAGLSVRAVKLALPELERLGWLVIERQSLHGVRLAHCYKITPVEPPPPADAAELGDGWDGLGAEPGELPPEERFAEDDAAE